LNVKRIVITGGPGTGKSSIISELTNRNYNCFEEISRQVTLKARDNGVDQLFLDKPLLFSELLLEARLQQFNDASKEKAPIIFYDRGLPDVLAYMDYAKKDYPMHFKSICKSHRYDGIFILPPWKEIYVSDNERYENFEQAQQIHKQLTKTYKHLNYTLITVPFGNVKERTDFILKQIEH